MMTDTERKKYYESALHTFSCEARAIAELDRNLDREAFLKTVELLSETQGRIILSACGGTATCARRAVQGFNNVDRAAQFLSPCDAPHGDYGMIRRGDILMLLSKSGKTQELEPRRIYHHRDRKSGRRDRPRRRSCADAAFWHRGLSLSVPVHQLSDGNDGSVRCDRYLHYAPQWYRS